MPHQKDIPIRDARDRLIDLLGFGETYPLRDLPILDERLTVPFKSSAKIPIEAAQSDVLYRLYDREDRPVTRPPEDQAIEAQGTGQTLLIESPLIEDDVTYKVRGIKNRSSRSAYLHETATIKVGLDVSLSARILTGEPLDPGIEVARETDARIVDYGVFIEVEIRESQEGVDYRLVYFEGSREIVLTDTDTRGNLADITLTSRAVEEDVEIRIRATKTFDPAEERETQTDLLDVVLPLKVRANSAVSVMLEPSSVMDYRGRTTLQIDDSQKSVQYQLAIQEIADRNFIHRTPSDEKIITVPLGDGRSSRILDPADGRFWHFPDGFKTTGSPKKGVDGPLRFSLGGLAEDTLIVVKAQKTHQAGHPVASEVQLVNAVAALVRPDPDPALTLKVVVTETEVSGPVEVRGGQPGVYYHLRRETSGPDLGSPAYFHKKDAQNPSLNKGLGQLKIGVDFAVPRSLSQDSALSPKDPAETFPENPRVDIQKIPIDTPLRLLAVKAQTGLDAPVSRPADIPALPVITFESAVVDAGTPAKVIVSASQPGEKYQLRLNGVPVRRARNGNGAALGFTTEPVTEETIFEMVVTRPAATDSLVVERVLLLKVGVRPGNS
ncbi:MAG: hypothetical protein ACE5F7_07085 [Nitrospiria bacterium]